MGKECPVAGNAVIPVMDPLAPDNEPTVSP